LYQLFALTFTGDISRTLCAVLPLQKHETKYNHYPLLRKPCHRELFSSCCLLAIVVLLQSLALALRRRERSSRLPPAVLAIRSPFGNRIGSSMFITPAEEVITLQIFTTTPDIPKAKSVRPEFLCGSFGHW
jgi:hypothetical protein